MPVSVHAVLVVRSDARLPAAHRLERTLAALTAQTHPLAALSIVLCGHDADTAAFASASSATAVIAATRSTGFAAAVHVATRDTGTDAVWLLAQDTVPEPDALEHLAGALEVAPSVAVAAPKLVRWDDRTRIVSLGTTMTRLGRSVGIADDEFDQGQHDAVEDVLGSDVRGILVRTEAWRELDGLDAALAGTEEGLDLGVRARLADRRVRVVPSARIAVHGDGVAELAGLPPAPTAAVTYARRRAQLHRRLAYGRAPALLLLWLSILPVALVRTVLQLIGKVPGRIAPEWGAGIVAVVRVDQLFRARARIRRCRRATWSRLAPLRMTREQLRTRLHGDGEPVRTEPGRSDLRFFSGGGAWAVLGALVVSIAMFSSLLAWEGIGGGALAPLRATVAGLWADAAYGLRPSGLHVVGPADPFSAVVAVIGSLWPADPSRAMVWLWLLALPLAVLGGWFASTRITERSILRVTGGIVWALAPTFLAALVQPRPAAVIVHLLLPWLFYAGSVAHRSWGSAGAASLLLAAVIACAPSLAAVLIVIWAVLTVAVLIVRRGSGAARLIWLPIPVLVLAAPVVLHQLRAGNPWGLLADPGLTWAGPQAASGALGRTLLAGGSPSMDPGGWVAALHAGLFGPWGAAISAVWMLVLIAPLGVLALASVFTRRLVAGTVLLAIALLGLGTAFAAVGIAVAVRDAAAVPLWPGNALSLAWAGVLGAALLTLEVGFARRGTADADLATAPGRVRVAAASLVMVALAAFAVPALTAHLRGQASFGEAASSTLPAFVAAEGRGHPGTGTVILRPLAQGALGASVVWGESETLGGQSTIAATATTVDADAAAVAALGADLAAPTSTDVVARLRADGIGFVLLTPAVGDDAARTLRLTAATALDARSGLDSVGDTERGTLWRVTQSIAPRAQASDDADRVTRTVALIQLLAVAAALLLAVPTAASRRRARLTPRVVGRRRNTGEAV